MTPKNTLNKIWRRTSNVITFLGKIITGIGMLLLIYWVGVWGYKNVFVPQSRSLTINLTDFDTVTVHSGLDCRLYPYQFYPYRADVSDLASNFVLDYEITSKQPIDFYIVFPAGKMTATNYADSQTQGISSDQVAVKEGERISGKVTKIELEIINSPEIELDEYICSPEFAFSSSATLAYWYGYETLDVADSLNGVATRQWLKIGDKIKVTLLGDLNLTGYASQNLEKIEFEIDATKDSSPLIIHAVSPGLLAKLPYVYKYSQIHDPTYPAWKLLTASGESIEIKQPAGILKLGNDNTIEVGKTIRNPDAKLLSLGGNSFSGNIVNGDYVITATTTSVILDGEQLVKTPWEALSGEAQVGWVGLLFTLVGGLWSMREPILKKIFPKNLQKKASISIPPPVGSFVCEMQSGIILAGELIREPSFFFPFYILCNARRKLRLAEEWETEVIAEIRIRANLVEQTYIFDAKQTANPSNKNS